MRWLNLNRLETPTEEDYYQYALMELGGDTPSWYGLVDGNLGYVYSNIKVIVDGFTKPSESDVNAKMTELKNAYASTQYKRERAKQYDSVVAQLDMMYWDKVNGTTNWEDSITKVKTDIPKE